MTTGRSRAPRPAWWPVDGAPLGSNRPSATTALSRARGARPPGCPGGRAPRARDKAVVADGRLLPRGAPSTGHHAGRGALDRPVVIRNGGSGGPGGAGALGPRAAALRTVAAADRRRGFGDAAAQGRGRQHAQGPRGSEHPAHQVVGVFALKL